MDLSEEKQLKEQKVEVEKENLRLRQQKFDKEQAALLLMAMRAELESKFSIRGNQRKG